jgi:hypothetical protein
MVMLPALLLLENGPLPDDATPVTPGMAASRSCNAL